MTRAEYAENTGRWHVATQDNTWSGRYLVMAVGNLSTTKEPTLPGQDGYRGQILHTARWPHDDVDLTGKRVGVIGTGSSGMQMIPVIAPDVAHLTVFQRTPNFSIPAANAIISDEQDAAVKLSYRERRAAAQNSPSGLGFVPNRQSALDATEEERRTLYEKAWTRLGFGFSLAYYDLLLSQEANDTAADFIRAKIAEQVADPVTREKLMPRGFPFGTKRPSVDSRQRLLHDVQPRQRHPRRHPGGAPRAPGRDRAAHRAGALRPGRPRVRHRLRRHDRFAAAA